MNDITVKRDCRNGIGQGAFTDACIGMNKRVPAKGITGNNVDARGERVALLCFDSCRIESGLRSREVRVQRLTLAIYGCGGGSAMNVERVLKRIPGVMSVYVNPATEMAYLEIDSDRVHVDEIFDAVKKMGFRAQYVREAA